MIRLAQEKDFDEILELHRLAFDEEDESDLIKALHQDETAFPLLSIVCEEDNQILGHGLFSKVYLEGAHAYIMSPLGVHPHYQFKGIGKRLIKFGLDYLNKQNVDLVFVLGDPHYYPQCGFECNAERLGFIPPHPIPKAYKDAWMVQELCANVIGRIKGQVQPNDTLSQIEYWSD